MLCTSVPFLSQSYDFLLPYVYLNLNSTGVHKALCYSHVSLRCGTVSSPILVIYYSDDLVSTDQAAMTKWAAAMLMYVAVLIT